MLGRLITSFWVSDHSDSASTPQSSTTTTLMSSSMVRVYQQVSVPLRFVRRTIDAICPGEADKDAIEPALAVNVEVGRRQARDQRGIHVCENSQCVLSPSALWKTHQMASEPVILCVAEKPSLAAAIAGFLASGGEYGTRLATPVRVPRASRAARRAIGSPASRAMFNLDFEQKYQSWDRPRELFGAGTVKTPSSGAVVQHIRQRRRLRPSRPLPRLRPRGREHLL